MMPHAKIVMLSHNNIPIKTFVFLCTLLFAQNSESFVPYRKFRSSSIRVFNTFEVEDTEYRQLQRRLKDEKFRERLQHWVVLVDDEESIRETVGDYLYDQGYKVTACTDATALLQVVSFPPTSKDPLPVIPDVIISDIRMPDKDGMDLLRYVRSNRRLERVPLILLTAKSMTEDRIAGYDAGADIYLTKPFDPEELLAIVDNLIVRRQQMTQGKAKLAEIVEEIQNVKQILKLKAAKVVKKTPVYLTPVQREVLEGICEGKSNDEIATDRGVSPQSIKVIVQNLFIATGLKKRTELIVWAFKTGYVRRQD